MRKGLWLSVVILAAGAGLVRADGTDLDMAPDHPAATSGWAVHEHHTDNHFDADACIYGGAEFLVWGIKGFPIPPLVTTGSAASKGFPGTDNIVTLIGNQKLDGDDPYYGGRFTLGVWLADDHTCGIEGNLFFLGSNSQELSVGSGTYPVLGRPFFRADTGASFGTIVALPGVPIPRDGTSPPLATGDVTVSSSSRLLGSEIDFRTNLCHHCNNYLDLIAGFRYLDLEESLTINEDVAYGTNLSSLGPQFAQVAGNRFVIADRFAPRNQFFGGEVGALGEYFVTERLSVGGEVKLAVGSTHEVVETDGTTIRTLRTGTVQTMTGGLLALPSNSGHHSKNQFGLVPEGLLNVSYRVTSRIRLSLGYDFLYWDEVVRPGDQIPRVIDPSQVPLFRGFGFTRTTPEQPLPMLKQSDFWAQGISAGLEFRW